MIESKVMYDLDKLKALIEHKRIGQGRVDASWVTWALGVSADYVNADGTNEYAPRKS